MPKLYRFHVNLLADPFPGTWEAAAAELEALQEMIFEPDGSWIWSGSDADGHRWHVNGHLFDFNNRLHRVELRGQCPPAAFDQLLACIGWPHVQLQFEQVREGTTLDEQQFREQTASQATQ